MGLGQYNSLVKYCGPHTVSSVFLISVNLKMFETQDIFACLHLWICGYDVDMIHMSGIITLFVS